MKMYVIVGVGGRATMFLDVFTELFPQTAKLLAICDKNQGRIDLAIKRVEKKIPNLKTYLSDDFNRMIKEQKPDCVIVCTQDSFHDEYICRSLEAGCDVISEKPMTTDEQKCQRVIDTVKKTGKNVRVTFNYRYSPPRTQMKDLLMSGIVGKVLSVELQWMLDTNHGADYFRRWHRYKKNSGGLMVHKATHHFDLINWWLSSTPVSVFAEGDRVFYNARQAKCYGLENHADRCADCSLYEKCNYYLDMNCFDTMKELYLDNEKYDGYFRDKCVFSDDIDIEDTMNVVVRYKSGAILSYSLNAFSPWEGYKVAINGTKGRIEQYCHESSYLNGDGSVAGAFQAEGSSIKVFPHFKTPYEIEVQKSEGSHGGGDIVMLNDIFGVTQEDPHMRFADYTQGAYSILVGAAANKSMATGKKVFIDEFVSGLDIPSFPEMPNGMESISYVPETCRRVRGEESVANVPVKVKMAEQESFLEEFTPGKYAGSN